MSEPTGPESAPAPIDPFYAADRVYPDPSGLSLFAEPGDDPCWLYLPGAFEAWLFNRLRHESFAASLRIFHPGRFSDICAVLYVVGQPHLDELPSVCPARFAACGNLHVELNDTVVLHRQATGDAPEIVEIDIAAHLRLGENRFRMRVHALGEPPALWIDSAIASDRCWQVSADDSSYETPNRLPFVGTERFPHRERLPEITLRAAKTEDDLWDFGRQVYGRPVVATTGTGTVRFFPGETASEALNADARFHEQHIPELRVASEETVSPVELALRFLRVELSPEVRIEKMQLLASTYPVQYRGRFVSSDPLLERVWLHAAHTLRLCMREVFLDGLKRDRLPWVGDLYLAGLSNAYSFFDPGIMRRSLLTLYSAEPERIDCNNIIDYSFFWILALHDYVLHFGDIDFLARIAPRLERLLLSLEARRDESGMIPTAACNWLFIDWAEVHKDGCSACLEFLALRASACAARLFAFLGDEAKAAQWEETTARRSEAARKRFWSDADGAFRDCTESSRTGRHANLLAVLAEVPTAEERRLLVASVLCNPAVPPVGTPYMRSLEAAALARCGRRDELLRILRGYWGGMIRAGASSFWERYSPADRGDQSLAMYGRPFGASLCHAWSAGPIFLMNRELFGLEPLDPGWQRFALTPRRLELEHTAVTIPTPHGAIRIEQRAHEVTVDVPFGTTLVCAGRESTGPERVTVKVS